MVYTDVRAVDDENVKIRNWHIDFYIDCIYYECRSLSFFWRRLSEVPVLIKTEEIVRGSSDVPV